MARYTPAGGYLQHAQSFQQSGNRPGRPVSKRPQTGGIKVTGSTYASARSNSIASASGITAEKRPLAKVLPVERRIFPTLSDDSKPLPRILCTPGTEDIDARLYHLLGLIIREYVQPWFSKITRERVFFTDVLRITSHAFREIESRVVPSMNGSDQTPKLDHLTLFCERFPLLIDRHYADYLNSQIKEKSAHAAGAIALITDLSIGVEMQKFEGIFHSLQPHAAIAPTALVLRSGASVPAERVPVVLDADYLRALVDGLLRAFLPTEDFEAETERAVVREVIVGIVLAAVLIKCTQPWFIYSLVAKLCEEILAKQEQRRLDQQREIQRLRERRSLWRTAVQFLNFISNAACTLYMVAVAFYRMIWKPALNGRQAYVAENPTRSLSLPSLRLARTVLRADEPGREVLLRILSFAEGLCFVINPWLDKTIAYLLFQHILTRRSVELVLDTALKALFPLPGEKPSPPPPDPDAEEQEIIKARARDALAQFIAQSVPSSALRFVFPGRTPAEIPLALSMDILDPLGSQYCNLHLFMFVIDLAVGSICPEMVVGGGT